MTTPDTTIASSPQLSYAQHESQFRTNALLTQPYSGRLRLLMVTPRYFPLMGGVENHVYEVARRLAQADVDITVLTTDTTGALPLHEELEGVKVQRVPAWPAQRDYYLAPDIYRVITRG